MIKYLLQTYKIPLFISITISVVLIALRVFRDPLGISLVLIGASLGTVLLDLDYIIYAYFIDPSKDFSKNLIAYIKHHDIKNAFLFIQSHKDDLEDKTLNSALFQIVFALFAIFVVASPTNYLIKALTISTLANSIYRMLESYYQGKIDQWFWALKFKLNSQSVFIYTVMLVGVLVYCVSIF